MFQLLKSPITAAEVASLLRLKSLLLHTGLVLQIVFNSHNTMIF